MSARPIGEFIAPIMARAKAMAAFQAMLGTTPTAAGRKHLIMSAREAGAIGDDDARLLIETYQLETA